MSTLTLYSHPLTPCPQRVLLTAHELGLKLNIINIDIFSDEHRTPEFLALTPEFSTVPILIDSSSSSQRPRSTSTSVPKPSFILRESRAICRYLALITSLSTLPSSSFLSPVKTLGGRNERRLKRGVRLMPTPMEMQKHARFEEAASLEVTGFDPLANKIVFEKYFRPEFGISGEPVDVTGMMQRLVGVLDAINRLLEREGRIWMAGGEFSLVDIFYIPYMHKLVKMGNDGSGRINDILEGRNGLKAWWERVTKRESYKVIFDGLTLEREKVQEPMEEVERPEGVEKGVGFITGEDREGDRDSEKTEKGNGKIPTKDQMDGNYAEEDKKRINAIGSRSVDTPELKGKGKDTEDPRWESMLQLAAEQQVQKDEAEEMETETEVPAGGIRWTRKHPETQKSLWERKVEMRNVLGKQGELHLEDLKALVEDLD